jgi:hypothetical protein
MKLSYSIKEIVKNIIFIILISVAGYCYIRWPFYEYIKNPLYFWLWLFGLLLLLESVSFFAFRIRNFRQGIGGEEDTEETLYNLPKDFEILSNLVINNRGNIDEVVVGPTGIWTIEVKSHIGKITFDGRELRRNGELLEKDFLKQAWAESYAVKKELEDGFNVQPVIVFSDIDAELHFGFKPISGVYVVGRSWLNKLITRTNIQRLNGKNIDSIIKKLEVYKE